MLFRLTDLPVACQLLDDLHRYAEGLLGDDALADAPLLQSYKFVVGPAYALGGIVSGHPRIADGREIVSSQLFFLDPERSVARTRNRWYRLGLPYGLERN